MSDHPALELLNTTSRVEGNLVDSLQSDGDVVRWLARMGHVIANDRAGFEPSALLLSAHALRKTVRTAFENRKAGKRVEAKGLNVFLRQAQSYLVLTFRKDGGVDLLREWVLDTPERALAPIAEAAAELLAIADFTLVKRCEGSECVLWFLDRTKSHNRRWCSTSTCGNRDKVAAFRRRQQGGA